MNKLFYICNALDDITRLERGITTDSPAASRKIFHMCKVLSKAGVRVYVISLGRGQQDGSGRYFKVKLKRVDGILTIYLPFLHFPIFSELLTLLSSVPIFWRLQKTGMIRTVLFYNRVSAYFPILIFAKALKIKTVLDLEDGAANLNTWTFSGFKTLFLTRLFDRMCSGGALLACEALKSATKLRPTQCCYGVSEAQTSSIDWNMPLITILFGGTISIDTGAPLLINAIRTLRKENPIWSRSIRFNITGRGDCLDQFKLLAESSEKPEVLVYGRTTDDEYKHILACTHVGLALKPNTGLLAQTTFPSKVIEFASQGILVVTTDISDVRKLLNDGAIYIEMDDSDLLIEKLQWIIENRDAARNSSLNGLNAVTSECEPETVGRKLRAFLFKPDSIWS